MLVSHCTVTDIALRLLPLTACFSAEYLAIKTMLSGLSVAKYEYVPDCAHPLAML